MRLTSAWLGCWALCASLAASAQEEILDPIHEDAEFLSSNKAAWRMSGRYVVVLRHGTNDSQVRTTMERLAAGAARRGYLVGFPQTYSGALRGFLVLMCSQLLDMALKLPLVRYIEEDSSIFAQSAPWNIQRLLQPYGDASENGTYRPPNDGGLAEVYLMDGGVQSSHREIEGRVSVRDFDDVPEEDGVRLHGQASQCESHGTHVAGVVSGSDSGVARGAGVNLVRVLNCQGKGSVSGALAGLEFIRATLRSRPVDAVVVLLPFIGGFSRTLNAACRDLVANGAVVIASAGNYRDDACLYSPASEPEVITVGAVNSVDQLMSQGTGGTNVGRCVDVFAPGDDIVSASSDCSTCFTSRSGTSQAAAHAAGIAAVILSSNQKASPVQVLQTMLRYSVSNTINFLSLSDEHRLVSPNMVAVMPPANSTNVELLCRSVWSERSEVRAVSRCRRGEEMMSCSGFAPDGVHVGETITVSSGRMECVASNATGGRGVFAVARCCVTTGGLQCRVHASPEPGRDAECVDPKHHLTGCSSWSSTAETSSDSRPRHRHGDHRKKSCVVRDGVTSHAVCCHAPSLECHLLENISADKDQVEVSCPSGWTLTDCNAVSQGAAIQGPVARGNSCRVRRATGAEVVVGVAVCCRVRSSPEEEEEQPTAPPH